jgi:hypothetical protein
MAPLIAPLDLTSRLGSGLDLVWLFMYVHMYSWFPEEGSLVLAQTWLLAERQ